MLCYYVYLRYQLRVVINVRYNFHIKIYVRLCLQLFVCLIMLYLRLFGHNGVQHILCCGFVCLHLVYPVLPVSLDYFSFVCLHLVYPVLPVSLDCLFFYCPLVFFNVYFQLSSVFINIDYILTANCHLKQGLSCRIIV